MMKQICLLYVTLLLVGFVFAATDTQSVEDTFKLNDKVNYAKPCFNNGSYCSSSAICNYTIYNPDKTILKNNVPATNNGSNFNITIYPQQIGNYQADMVCCDGVNCGSETMYFETTGSGLNDNNWFYIIVLVLSLGIMILGFALKDAPIVILGSFGMVFLGLYILLNGISSIQNQNITYAIGVIILSFSGYIGIRSSYELIVDDE